MPSTLQGFLISTIVPALVSGTISLTTLWMSKKIERKTSAEKARLEYEYVALGKLYEQIEPLTFQIFEASKHVMNRLKRVVTKKKYTMAYSFDEGEEKYEEEVMIFSLYNIFLLVFYLSIFKRKLTFVDIRLNKRLYIIYHLLLIYYWTFGDHICLRDLIKKSTDIEPDYSRHETIGSADLDLAIDLMTAAAGSHPVQSSGPHSVHVLTYQELTTHQFESLPRVVAVGDKTGSFEQCISARG